MKGRHEKHRILAWADLQSAKFSAAQAFSDASTFQKWIIAAKSVDELVAQLQVKTDQKNTPSRKSPFTTRKFANNIEYGGRGAGANQILRQVREKK